MNQEGPSRLGPSQAVAGPSLCGTGDIRVRAELGRRGEGQKDSGAPGGNQESGKTRGSRCVPLHASSPHNHVSLSLVQHSALTP